ncbi:MAG: hypothetical protein ACRDZO_21110 [Egibacteraceae bacterium]
MAEHTIRRIFLTPPVAIARLGGSLTPLVAFEWARGDPHTIAETRIRPAWTLDVLPDGTVAPRMPATIVVRDGALLRPVAPFLELWALTGDGPPQALAAVPVTPDLLASNGASERDLTFTVEAMNLKAARRTGRASLRFGTFPPVEARGDDHRALQLLGSSPPATPQPMIPVGRFIPLGQVQVLRPVAQPADQPWSSAVRVDVVRLRFTPARGRFYGPPGAAQVQPPAVPLAQAFLNAAAGWEGAARSDRVVPADTVDERAPGVSLGVVDDTCDAQIVAELALAGGPVRCTANVTVGPPQYAPDRRPFLSLADEINDRQHDPGRDAALSDADRAAWVEDLFERAFETASAMDLDFWRAVIARGLRPDERRSRIPGDGVPQPTRAMGGEDRLRDPEIAIPEPSANIPLPLSERARERHRDLSDLAALESWVREHPDRLGEIIRAPFANTGFSMQMPPFMRNSNALALSLAQWQYDLLMAWADAVTAPSTLGPVPDGGLAPLSPEAAERRRQVLAALDAAEDGGR